MSRRKTEQEKLQEAAISTFADIAMDVIVKFPGLMFRFFRNVLIGCFFVGVSLPHEQIWKGILAFAIGYIAWPLLCWISDRFIR